MSKSDFNCEMFKDLFTYEEKHFWFQKRNELILAMINKYCKNIKNLLEVGCGNGIVNAYLRKNLNTEIWGSELHDEGLYYAQQRFKDRIIKLDARDIPYTNKFDAIGIFDVLEHIDEDELVLSQINKALVNHGKLIITVPQHMFLWSNQDVQAHHKRRYSGSDLIRKLNTAGFKVVRKTSFMTLLLPVVWLARKTVSRKNVTKELDIPNYLNTVFKFLLTIENTIIKTGISLPFGVSLLVIAEKI